MKPYLDDFAQICGTKITEILGSNQVALGLGKSYAICVGADEAEARNVHAVLEKNVRAAHVAEAYGEKPMAGWECRVMRLIYQKKYSAYAKE